MTCEGFEVRELQSSQTSIPAYIAFLIKKEKRNLYLKGNFTWNPFILSRSKKNYSVDLGMR